MNDKDEFLMWCMIVGYSDDVAEILWENCIDNAHQGRGEGWY